MSQRKMRVEHGLRDVLTQLIANDVRDPRVHAAKLVTVSRVELTVDLEGLVARVYVSIIGDDATIDGVIAGLDEGRRLPCGGPAGRELGLSRPPGAALLPRRSSRYQRQARPRSCAKTKSARACRRSASRSRGCRRRPRIRRRRVKPTRPAESTASTESADDDAGADEDSP